MKTNISLKTTIVNKLVDIVIILLLTLLNITLYLEIQNQELSITKRILGLLLIILFIYTSLVLVFRIIRPTIIGLLLRKYISESKLASSLFASFIILVLMGVLGTIFSFLPDINHPSIIGILLVWFISIIRGICFYWNKIKPNLIAEYLESICLPTLMLLGSIHFISYFIIGWLWMIPLLSIYLLAWILPLINSSIAKKLSNEQYGPKTFIGKLIMRYLLGIIWVITLILQISNENLRNMDSRIILLGLLSGCLSIALSQVYSFQLYEKRNHCAQHAAAADLAKAQRENTGMRL